MRIFKKINIISLIFIFFITVFCPIPDTALATPVDRVAPTTFDLTVDNQTLSVPCYMSHSPETAHSEIVLGVIVVHGTNRNAGDYFDRIKEASTLSQAKDRIAVFAPQFLEEEDITAHGLSEQYCFWGKGWRGGDQSLSTTDHPRSNTLSSYSFVDEMVRALLNSGYYPSLKGIVVVGHSAGGQFTNRYAAGNRVDSEVKARGLFSRYVVANPSSYLYFDERRRVEGTTDRFEVPDSSSCTYYNVYHYGLSYLNEYMTETGPSNIINQYKARIVAYLLGGADTNPADSTLDTSCPAMMQGDHRLERGQIYYNYLGVFFGESIYDIHVQVVVPGVAHSSTGIFKSEAGLKYIFGLSSEDGGGGETGTSSDGGGGGCLIESLR